MSRKGHTTEQIVNKLRQADVELAKGQSIAAVCKQIGVTDQTYYRWRKEYGGLKVDQAKRFKELEQENARLKRLLADAELDKAILREAARRSRRDLRHSSITWPANVSSEPTSFIRPPRREFSVEPAMSATIKMRLCYRLSILYALAMASHASATIVGRRLM
jgi:transposase-like protein